MEGKKSDGSAVSATVERVARYTVLSKLSNHTAREKQARLVKRLRPWPKEAVTSITADRGPENRKHEQLTPNLNVPVYFCNAYHSWEKGTVENTIGRLRRYLPKGMSLDGVTAQELAKIEWELNHTPRKCLTYLTPCEKMQELLQTHSGALPVRM